MSFLSDIGTALSGITGGLGDIISPLVQLGQLGMGIYGDVAGQQQPTSTGYEPGGSNTWYNPAGSTGQPTTLGATPVVGGANVNDLLGLGGTLLGFVGALNRNRAQQKLLKQSKQAYANFLGPHVDYHMGDNPQTVTGLAPSGPVETAGFRPEDTLTKTGNTTPMAMGGLPAVGALSRTPALPAANPFGQRALQTLPWQNQRTGLSQRPPLHPGLLHLGYSGPGASIGRFPRGYAGAGQVGGEGGGQDDNVPAYLSPDEYVIPADVVSHLGDGSSNEGARKLDELVARVRERRTGNDRFPPRVGALGRAR